MPWVSNEILFFPMNYLRIWATLGEEGKPGFYLIYTYNLFWNLLFIIAEDDLSMLLDESGWAWLVHKDRLIIWKIGQSSIAKVK